MKKTFCFIPMLTLMMIPGIKSERSKLVENEPCMTALVVNDNITLTRAAITAQDFVKQKFFYKCNFSDRDIRGEQTSVRNRWNVLQKFTCKKDGVERQYVYKCILQYNGGDWTEKRNWTLITLIVEDVNTGKQWKY